MTRVLLLGDNHAGHRGGLTPPAYWYSEERDEGDWPKIQREAWNWYAGTIADLQPIDVALHLGDSIEGPGKRNGGTELISTDLLEQVKIATETLAIVKPRRGWVMVYGTPYHTTDGAADFDGIVANNLGAEIHNHAWVNVDGTTFDIKHKLGGSSTPTGGDIALRKEILWSHEWALAHGYPICDYIVRGHVHRERVVDNARSLPSLQLWTKYGGRQCTGLVNFGLTWCDIEDGEATWHSRKTLVESARPSMVVM